MYVWALPVERTVQALMTVPTSTLYLHNKEHRGKRFPDNPGDDMVNEVYVWSICVLESICVHII